MAEQKNIMIAFADNNRTTTYFRDSMILQIRIAYKIMEYLAPDSVFPPKANQFTKNLMLEEKFPKAYGYVIEELDNELHVDDLGSSSGAEYIERQAIALMKHLLPIYKKGVTDAKEKRRIALIEELNSLDNPDA